MKKLLYTVIFEEGPIMKSVIREYLELTEQEKLELWEKAIFVFDTNVFLNLYRYTPKTTKQLLNAFEQLKDRIWMPYQVAFEFSRDRYEVIYEANERFKNLSIDAEKLVKKWTEDLRTEKNDSDVQELTEFLKKWIEKKEQNNCLITNPMEDNILTKLLSLFENKVGQPYTKEEKDKIEAEGEKRYSNNIPPGYKDKKKIDNKYGDLLVWKEILKYATAEKKDIIFVTHDQKEDWWNQIHGKTIGPRIELRKEFYDQTHHMFHMYTMSSFLSNFGESTGEAIDTTTIDEVELFSAVIRKKTSRKELNKYYDYLENENERQAAQIRFEITRLENKNRKRGRVINNLYYEGSKGKLSEKKVKLLENNVRNFEKDLQRIEQLRSDLKML